jgi:pyrroloquinoline quinone biosynthesis protein B
LLNASPDVRTQIELFPVLSPCGEVRGTNIAGILLTNADLDHTLGLLVLREDERLTVHATAAVRQALTGDGGLADVLGHYCGVEWRNPPADLAPLLCRDGARSGLQYAAFPVPGQPPRYLRDRASASGEYCVGYILVDETTGGTLLYLPGVAALDETVMSRVCGCDALLLDGTFWSNDEMQIIGVGGLSAAEMGHLPVGGPDGSLERIAQLPIRRKIYIHINNTNPMLIEDSPAHRAVRAAGADIGWDGLELSL